MSTHALTALLTKAAEMGRTDGDRDARFAGAYALPPLTEHEATTYPRGRDAQAFADYLLAGRDYGETVRAGLITHAGSWYASGYAELVEAHADATVTVPTT